MQAVDVGLQADCEPLVGEIHQWQEALLLQQPRQDAPLIRCQIGASRIVAATVQQDHIALWNTLHSLQHGLEVDAVSLAVEVGVFSTGEPRRFEDLVVIRPGRLRHPDPGLGTLVSEQICRHSQSTCAARCMSCQDATAGDDLARVTEQ